MGARLASHAQPKADVQRDVEAAARAPVLGSEQLELRLRQEVARALRYRRELALLCVQIVEGKASAEHAALIADTMRFVDIVGWDGAGEFIVLLPETGAAADVPARRLLDALTARGVPARVGLVRCPEDASDAPALMRGARDVASRAEPGRPQALDASQAAELTVAGQSIVAADPKTRRLFELVRDLAQSDLAVLVEGETGVGKEVVARALHEWSSRSGAPFVAMNCAAMPETLLESELFGYERGAFSGAESAKPGLLESASGGVVFLDEIGEASPRTQAELLRVLETRQARRLGSLREYAVDVRFVAATNRDLASEVQRGTFRRDLLYRLNAAMLQVPRLVERPLDIPVLLRRQLEISCRQRDRFVPTFDGPTLEALLRHDWPGNVRELRNVVDFALAVCSGDRIGPAALPASVLQHTPWAGRELATGPTAGPQASLEAPRPCLADEVRELEERRMREALEHCDGVRVRAAEWIGMPLRTFVTKLKQYGLQDVGRAEE